MSRRRPSDSAGGAAAHASEWDAPVEGDRLDQPAVADLGARLIRDAETARFDPPPLVDFDRDEIAAILRRASELGARSGTKVDELDSSTLADIAAQVGIPASAVAAAVVERRVGLDPKTSLADRLIGPDQIWAGRRSKASGDETNSRLVEWLERGHGLRSRRTDDGVIVATRRSGIAGSVSRGVRSVQGLGGLGNVREVRGATVSIEAGSIDAANDRNAADGSGASADGPRDAGGAVALLADVSDKRNGAMLGGGAVATVGVAAVGTVAALTATPLVLVALPAAAGAGLLTSRLAFRPTVRRVTNELEYTADQIARGEDAPSLLSEIATPITDRLRRRS